MKKSISVRWRSASTFDAVSEGDGGRALLAGDEEETGYRPTTLLLTALAACAGMDVMAICRKKRQAIERYEVLATGDQRPAWPRTFATITVEHRFEGGSVQPDAVRRAILLSATQYCPVSAHLSQGDVTISHRYRVSGAGGEVSAEVVVTGPNGAGLAPARSDPRPVGSARRTAAIVADRPHAAGVLTLERAPITAVLITLDEEHNLEYCLRSLRPWCDEIIVVDMLSEDRTTEIAARYADLVLPHQRIEAFDQARGAGIERARNEWIVVLDADELIPPRLGQWIADWVRQGPPHDVALLPRVNVFLGRWIRSSNWWPGLPRLFRRDSMRISAQLHRGLQPVPGARVKRLPKDPQLSIWHFSYGSLDSLTHKTNRYTTIEARQAIARGRPVPKPWQFFPKALRALWWDYVMRRGYRDGRAGLTYAINRAYYRYMSMAKRWDEREAPGRQAHYDRMREDILGGYGTDGDVGADGDAPAEAVTAVPSDRAAAS